MASKKRPMLLARSNTPRGAERGSVLVAGKYSVSGRPAEDVLITDLSASGCRLRANSIGVTKTEPIEIWLGEFGPIAAKLKWLKKGSLGLAFDKPLDHQALQALLDVPAEPRPSNVVPLHRKA